MAQSSWVLTLGVLLAVVACSPRAGVTGVPLDAGADAAETSVAFDAAERDGELPPDATLEADAPDAPLALDAPDAPDVPLAPDVVDAANDAGSAPDVVDASALRCTDDSDCGLGNYCTGGSCARQLCPPNARECVDTGRRRACDPRGIAWTDTACGGAEVCTAGNCVARVCAPGAAECLNASTRRICTADGLRFTTAGCSSAEVCSGGACVPRTCTAGSASCLDGTTRRVCNSSGSGYDTTPCPAGQGCSAGTCRAFVCTPNTATCGSPTERSVCAADGLSSTRTSCAAMQTCRDGACASWTCTPNAATCASSTERSVCAADGLSATRENCPAGTTCSGGSCVGAADACPGVEVVPDGAPLRLPLTSLRVGSDASPCGTPGTAVDWVARFTLTRPRDVRIVATGAPGVSQSFVLRRGSCTGPEVILRCIGGIVATQTYRALEPGQYFVVVRQQSPVASTDEGTLTVTTSAPESRPAGDGCANPVDLVVDGPEVTVSSVGFDNFTEQDNGCRGGDIGPYFGPADVYWRFRTTTTRDLRIDLSGCGARYRIYRGCGPGRSPITSCRTESPPFRPEAYREWLRAAPPGEYTIVTEVNAGLTCRLRVSSTDVGFVAPGDTCEAPLTATVDGGPVMVPFDARLVNEVSSWRGCTGAASDVDAFVRFRLAAARDVTINVPTTGGLSWALLPGCGAAAGHIGACATAPVVLRGLPAGDYVIALRRAWHLANVVVPVSVTTTPTTMRAAGDTCANPVAVGLDGFPAMLDLTTAASTVDIPGATSCSFGGPATSTRNDAYFVFDLPDVRDVEVNVDAPAGSQIELGRGCGHHIPGPSYCRAQGVLHNIIASGLPAGRYFISVYNTGTSATVIARVNTAPAGTRVGYAVTPIAPPEFDSCSPSALTSGTGSLAITVPFDFRFFGRMVSAGSPATLTALGSLVLDNSTPAGSSFRIGESSGPNFAIIGNLSTAPRMAGICTRVSGTAPSRRWTIRWFQTYRDPFSGVVTTPTLTAASIREQTGAIDLESESTANGLEDISGRPFVAPPRTFVQDSATAVRLVPFP